MLAGKIHAPPSVYLHLPRRYAALASEMDRGSPRVEEVRYRVRARLLVLFRPEILRMMALRRSTQFPPSAKDPDAGLQAFYQCTALVAEFIEDRSPGGRPEAVLPSVCAIIFLSWALKETVVHIFFGSRSLVFANPCRISSLVDYLYGTKLALFICVCAPNCRPQTFRTAQV